MLDKITKNINARMATYTDSRNASSDEIAIA